MAGYFSLNSIFTPGVGNNLKPKPAQDRSSLGKMSGSAVSDLGMGYGGDELAGETEEEKKKRMQEAQQRQMMGSSLAAQMVFGSAGRGGVGGAGGTGY